MVELALPPEVLDEIFQYFSDDSESLKVLSLVSQSFLECSRPWLFSYLQLELEHSNIPRLTEVLHCQGKHIIFLYFGLGNHRLDSGAELPSPLAISKLIGNLPNLQIFHLRMDHCESGAEYMINAALAALKAASALPHVSHLKLKISPCLSLLNPLTRFPSLKHLIIHFRNKYDAGKPLEHADETCSASRPPIFLESLKLYWEGDAGELYQWLLGSSNPIKVTKVKRFTAASPFQETSTHCLLQQLLDHCSSLEDFYLYPTGTFKHWQPEEGPLNFNVCKRLRALGFRIVSYHSNQSQKDPMLWATKKLMDLDVNNSVESLTLDMVFRYEEDTPINVESTLTNHLQFLKDSLPSLQKLRIRATFPFCYARQVKEQLNSCLKPYKMDWSVEFTILAEPSPGRAEQCNVTPRNLRRVGSHWDKLILCWDVTDYGM